MQAMRHDDGNNSTLDHLALVMISLSDLLAIPNSPGGVFGFSGGAAVRKRLGQLFFPSSVWSGVPPFRCFVTRPRESARRFFPAA